MADPKRPDSGQLKRQVGVGGAVLLGLGSILGTGVFVSIGIAVGVTGPSVVAAIAIAAAVAICNGLSSAQLAASHPVSGGTYAYGYRYLTPTLGYTAGWMFLSAKSASAATAALGFAGYLLTAFGQGVDPTLRVVLALTAVVVLTGLVLTGLRRSNAVNAVIVGLTIFALGVFIVAAFAYAGPAEPTEPMDDPYFAQGFPGLMEAAALMFVAYTGYGRVATLGEEIKEPRRNIPKAVIATLGVTALLYLLVGWSGITAVGAPFFAKATAEQAAPLEVIARVIGGAGIAWVLAVGAIVAMLGVLLNLILGLSRVALAMGREGDFPRVFGRVNQAGTTPVPAVLLVGVIIAGLACLGDVKTTWTFSAFTVLIYYALTNVCALRLAPEDRLYPRVFPIIGLVGCLGLAFWVSWPIWVTGLALLAAGLVLRVLFRRINAAHG